MKIEPLFTAEQMDAALRDMAAKLIERFGDERPVKVLSLLNGALWFTADLLRLLPVNFILETARVSSYGAARETSGTVTWKTPVPYCEDMRVLVLDDVLDSGVTLKNVKAELLRLGAAEVVTAVAVDKPEGRRVEFEADYVGLVAPNLYLVGYGMDADGTLYRNLPYVGVVRD
ncbi:MAG: hypothetical protein IKW48_03770 [Akkermansia sp.]|jgi:hypoxanthine phosphoribosyltransferase|nr:hypothetical protein [Akkermansia sp.]